ncbi:MAG: prephenate dehydratase [Candidatus Jordarchaeum sp.]|uniref:prephenate dehydratase n=1 Tax=Candidatus Jordarchaeum sp. TaxID=2823881 RepID=UPI004049DFC6
MDSKNNSQDKLIELRKKIDEIDQQIVEFLAQRREKIRNLAEVKSKLKLKIRDQKRETQVITNSEKLAIEKGLDPNFINKIFLEIIDYGRRVESEARGELKKIAYLSPKGTFTEEAALIYISGTQAEMIPMSTIGSIISAVENGHVDMGIVPIENSVEGTVTITLDLLARSEAKICGEIILPVVHNLISKEKISLDKLTKVYSHPQALAQCRTFLTKKLPHVYLYETHSTAEAVKMVAEEDDANIAAIGSYTAARLYGMNILAEGIQDEQTNETRFAVLASRDSEPTGSDKTSIAIFLLQDRPGALCEVLEEFRDRNINLTRIESRPSKKVLGDYIFFVDLEGHRKDPKVKEAVENIGKKAGEVKIMGSFPTAKRKNKSVSL